MKKLNILCYSVLIVFCAVIIPFINFFSHNSFNFETSVWCFRGLNKTNFCKFKNICYSSQYKTFLFFLTKNSVIKGLNNYEELQKIQLSSVLEHNKFFANMSVVDIENFNFSQQLKIFSKGLLMSRFKSNNLMHTFHDDLFPIFLTLESACLGDLNCMRSYYLLFHDDFPEGPFIMLYKTFSEYSPIILSQVTNENVCFKEILTGLAQDGMFYQYGFNKPHGPVKTPSLTQKDIVRFTDFLKSKLEISNDINTVSEILLFCRKKNRKILNISEVKEMIYNTYKKLNKNIQVTLIELDLNPDNLKPLIQKISKADGLIGMHGAEMILSIFLKPQSFVIEIFPFGINPNVVSFVKPISELSGSNFMYFSWRNNLKKNSVAHPNAHPLFGGISHLNEEIQNEIRNTLEVPAVECCYNSTFLYHMYQDTLIPNEFKLFLFQLFSNISTTEKVSETKILNKWFYPSVVSNVGCNFQLHERTLNITWNPPFNINTSLTYSLYIRNKNGSYVKDISTDRTFVVLETPIGVNPPFEIWISVYYNGFKSNDLYINCNSVL